MTKTDALNGALVADAAAMGLHWMYDQEQLRTIALSGDVLFRPPDAAVYSGIKSYFAHPMKRSGEASHYGESARLIAELARRSGGYQREAHLERFMQVFGPCGSYYGFADRPTKFLIGAMLTSPDDLPAVVGTDDDQMPPLACVPGLFESDADHAALTQAVGLFTNNPVGLAGAETLMRCLTLIASGSPLADALLTSAEQCDHSELQQKLLEALAFSGGEYDPQGAAVHFGLPCHMTQGLPVAWHLLKHSQNFESSVRDNIMCGGDCCGRSMAIGAVAGLVYGIPASLRQRVQAGLFG